MVNPCYSRLLWRLESLRRLSDWFFRSLQIKALILSFGKCLIFLIRGLNIASHELFFCLFINLNDRIKVVYLGFLLFVRFAINIDYLRHIFYNIILELGRRGFFKLCRWKALILQLLLLLTRKMRRCLFLLRLRVLMFAFLSWGRFLESHGLQLLLLQEQLPLPVLLFSSLFLLHYQSLLFKDFFKI